MVLFIITGNFQITNAPVQIRDLEQEVEKLRLGKDEAFLLMDGMMQDLNRENQALRQLVKELAGFIGEGIGGFLPKLGWDIGTFDEFKGRSDTDTMSMSFQARKKDPTAPANVVPVLAGQKRRTEDSSSLPRKKTKPNSFENEPSSSMMGSQPQPPTLQIPAASTSYPQLSPTQVYSGQHSSNTSVFTRDYNTGSYIPPNPSTTPVYSAAGSVTGWSAGGSGKPLQASANTPGSTTSGSHAGGGGGGGSSNSGGVNGSVYNAPQSTTLSNTAASGGSGAYSYPMRATPSETSSTSINNAPSQQQQQQYQKLLESQDKTREEVGRLIKHHLTNYKRNPSYTLPASLRPTHVQRTIAHEGIVDGIPIPELRDRMILYKDQFDLIECVHMLLSTIVFHTDDLLTVSNWEISEQWFNQFGFLATRNMLDITNKWRRERNDPEIPLSVIEGPNRLP
ncbi:hypothetical protein CPB86DRAFT_812571 [Serendipita vermifera]|nr:hypothetical protein CPB86DRAFT_812571 [Serendipita vermifera]